MAEYLKKSDVVAYIRKEAEEAQSAFEELGGESGIIAEAYEDLASELEDFTAADVAPVRHGRWEEADLVEPDHRGFELIRTPKAAWRCSRCRHCFKKELLWKDNCCPNCGARMDGAE